MVRPRLFRPVAATGLILGLFLAASGCGGKKPEGTKAEKKADTTSTPPPVETPKTTPPVETKLPQMPPPAEKVDPDSPLGKEATEFVKVLTAGTVIRADKLSPSFAKAVGLPAVLPDDKAKGYSPDNAESWLRRVGSGKGLSLYLVSKQVGDVAMFRGMFIGGIPGTYALRMVNDKGAWKVDWLSVTSANVEGAMFNTSNGDTACQEFAVVSVIGVLCDKGMMAKDDRALVLGSGLTPALKTRWAEPLGSDKAEGFDYNRGLLAKKAEEFSQGTESFSIAQVPGTADFRVELTRAGAAKKSVYLVKLVKGAGPGQWLVDDVLKTE